MLYFSIQHFSIRQGQGPHRLIEKTPLQAPSGARSRPSGYVELLLQRLVPREASTVWKAVFAIYYELYGRKSWSVTRQSGSMDRYSLEQFTQRLLPGLRPVSPVVCLDSHGA